MAWTFNLRGRNTTGTSTLILCLSIMLQSQYYCTSAEGREMWVCAVTMWPAIKRFPGISLPKPQSCTATVQWFPQVNIRMDGTIALAVATMHQGPDPHQTGTQRM
mmetsp:Transcript_5388/g.9311  ORF Transcript_5388/g.9311 Transcript_5388/m.9311 type:complete len:105 (+) Transcript_5388:450-764(+)